MNEWKNRLIEEYKWTKERYEKLKAYNSKKEIERQTADPPAYKNAEEHRKVNLDDDLRHKQQRAMGEYLHFLELRATLHEIDLISGGKLPDWYEDLAKYGICIVFNEPFEYNCFRAKYSDILLLPSAHDIYAIHPEIAENKWPVVIRAERYGVVKTAWSIAQSDYRKRRTISGLDWFEYDELEDYEQAKNYNENCWSVAREMRGKNTPAPGEKNG